MNLFFYGTLRIEQVRKAVLGDLAAQCRLEPATLSGYEVRRVTGALYPMLCKADSTPNSPIQGLVLHAPSLEMIELLDKFEGSHYHRIAVEIGIQSRSEYAEIYWPNAHLKPAELWVLEEWMENHMESFFENEFSTDGVHPPQTGKA